MTNAPSDTLNPRVIADHPPLIPHVNEEHTKQPNETAHIANGPHIDTGDHEHDLPQQGRVPAHITRIVQLITTALAGMNSYSSIR